MQRINPNNIVKVKALKTELTFELLPMEGNTEITINFSKKSNYPEGVNRIWSFIT